MSRNMRRSQPVFKYLLRLPDGQPPDPALLVPAVPTWAVGDVMTVGRGEQLRVIAITTSRMRSSSSRGIGAIFTVEPVVA